jgi:hypothetical protein
MHWSSCTQSYAGTGTPSLHISLMLLPSPGAVLQLVVSVGVCMEPEEGVHQRLGLHMGRHIMHVRHRRVMHVVHLVHKQRVQGSRIMKQQAVLSGWLAGRAAQPAMGSMPVASSCCSSRWCCCQRCCCCCCCCCSPGAVRGASEAALVGGHQAPP